MRVKSVEFPADDFANVSFKDETVTLELACRMEGKRNRTYLSVTISMSDWVRLVRRSRVHNEVL